MSKGIEIEQTTLPALGSIREVYFIGIGGIGMSAIARYFHSRGVKVSGYDKTPTELTDDLQQEGIAVHFTEDISLTPANPDLIVYTPAIPSSHQELAHYHANNAKVVKRSDVLQVISRDSFNICVAGTHGKTTISTMIAHILRHSGYGCNAFLGGISVNYNTNFWSSENETAVIEADEYDRSFLKLDPNVAVISAMDPDHLDIYGDEATMQDAFIGFGNKIRPDGLLIHKFGLKRMKEITVAKKWSYSVSNDAADAHASDVRIAEGGYHFNIQLPGAFIGDVDMRIGGMHNVENAVAASAVAHSLDIDAAKIKAALEDFKGVRRRFEYVLPPQKQKQGGYIYPVMIDDYAHHPEELRALLQSAKRLFPQRKLTVIFQPHLFTRTRDLANGFAEVLGFADKVVLLPIYPARELPIEGVSSEMILKKIDRSDKEIVQREELVAWAQKYATGINKEFGEVIITAGAGDIDKLVQPLKKIFENA
jgi:UDP-N-acetylmuramate--alanine ligase